MYSLVGMWWICVGGGACGVRGASRVIVHFADVFSL